MRRRLLVLGTSLLVLAVVTVPATAQLRRNNQPNSQGQPLQHQMQQLFPQKPQQQQAVQKPQQQQQQVLQKPQQQQQPVVQKPQQQQVLQQPIHQQPKLPSIDQAKQQRTDLAKQQPKQPAVDQVRQRPLDLSKQQVKLPTNDLPKQKQPAVDQVKRQPLDLSKQQVKLPTNDLPKQKQPAVDQVKRQPLDLSKQQVKLPTNDLPKQPSKQQHIDLPKQQPKHSSIDQVKQPQVPLAKQKANDKLPEQPRRIDHTTAKIVSPIKPQDLTKDRIAKTKEVESKVAQLKPDQKRRFEQLRTENERKLEALHKPPQDLKKTSSVRVNPKDPIVQNQIAKADLAKQLQEKAKSSPSLQKSLDKIQGKSKERLKTSDLVAVQKHVDPTKPSVRNLLFAGQTRSVSDDILRRAAGFSSHHNPSTTSAEKTVFDKYLRHPRSFSVGDQAILTGMLDRLGHGGNSPQLCADRRAITAILVDVRSFHNCQNALFSFTDPNNLANPINPVLGGLLGILFSGGGVLGYPPVDGYVDSQACLPPLVQTVFYPLDPTVTFDTEDMDLYPSVPGVAVAITSEPALATEAGPPPVAGEAGSSPAASEVGPSPVADEIGSSPVVLAGGTETESEKPAILVGDSEAGAGLIGSAGFDDLGSVAFAAAPWQTTRFLRLGNNTADEIAVHIRYYVDAGKDKSVWIPADPDDANGEWSTFRLSPGESADVMVGEWRVNARKIRIWAESPTTKWNTFRNTELDLVPEPEHQYQSEMPQVFHFTVQ